MRGVHRGLPFQRLRPYLAPLVGVATVDVEELAGARDLRDFVERLAGTGYHAPLAAAFHRVESAGPFALEVALELDFYQKLWLAADSLKRSDADRARRILGTLFDVLNLSWIATYRGALGIPPEETVNYTLREGRHLDPGLRRRLAEGETWEDALARTPYGRILSEASPPGREAACAALWRHLARVATRELSSDPFHIGVPLGLLLSLEIEVRDLRIILAAKALALPAAELRDRLASVRAGGASGAFAGGASGAFE
jgi:vacuolar-type H+-ATPase subunit C/Vma6